MSCNAGNLPAGARATSPRRVSDGTKAAASRRTPKAPASGRRYDVLTS